MNRDIYTTDLSHFKILSIIEENDISKFFQIEEEKTGNIYLAILFKREIKDTKKTFDYFTNEINSILKLNHPTMIKYKSFCLSDFSREPHPVILAEFVSKATLSHIIAEKELYKSKEWNNTKKLINIYGIASFISYLHKNKIIHGNLNLDNIFETNQLYPKIAYFNFSKIENKVLNDKNFFIENDIYSFGLILQSIMKSDDENQNIPQIYQNLIDRCLSKEPSSRPTFETIVNELRNNPNYITDFVDKSEYEEYIRSIESTTNFDLNQFELVDEIGSGWFSKVFQIRNKKTKKIFAAKIMKNENDEDDITNEVTNLSQCNHPSIVEFIGYSPIDFKGETKSVIITEYLNNRSLEDLLEVERNGISIPWSDTGRLIVIYGIASAVSYLHSIEIIHCDLKPANVLLDDFLFPKLIDFGLSRKSNSNKKPKLKVGMVGTASFIAPEILKENKYSKKSDVYAFGMIVYEIMNRAYPFDGTRDVIVEYKVSVEGKRPDIKMQVPKEYKNLIESCWNQDPNKRPSFDSIINDLESKKEFITEKVNESEFRSYIEYIRDKIITGDAAFQKCSLQPYYDKYVNMMKEEMLDF